MKRIIQQMTKEGEKDSEETEADEHVEDTAERKTAMRRKWRKRQRGKVGVILRSLPSIGREALLEGPEARR